MTDLTTPDYRVAEVPRLLLTYQQAADALAISKAELERIVAAGEIRPFRRGRMVRFTVAALEAFIEANTDQGA